MVRLQRVTLLSLHQYLGLGTELINPEDRGNAENIVTRAGELNELGIDGPANSDERVHNLGDLPEEELAIRAQNMIKQKLGLLPEVGIGLFLTVSSIINIKFL